MKVCITEKPSVARTLAEILKADRKRDGYFEGDGVCVTWTFGHLCTLKEPHDYTPDWKSWRIDTLPMVPPRFGIKLIPEKSIEHQFDVIRQLIHNADEVINCGDAGQEGELIQRWVMQKAEIKCPVRRLWISSLTSEAIREGFKNLQPQSEYDNLYAAGLSRAIGDWLLGMNATRLYTLRYGGYGTTLSVGRVQTPTLALIVERQRQIDNFKPEDFWELKTTYRDIAFAARQGRFTSIDKANEALEQIKGKPFTVTDVTKKKGRESAPRLFDLTSLQVECNRLWGWTADDTLKLIQSLYEKKTTTYPRVDTTYLPSDLYPKIPEIMQRMTPYASLTAPVLAGKIVKSKKVFDDAKITDHHAIIPTGEPPTSLVGDERRMYHLIARRFIAVFYPDCIFDTTTVTGMVDKVEFRATGKVIVDRGWRVIYDGDTAATKDDKADDADNDNRVLPDFTVGESGPHTPSLVKKTTTPPKPYTEGTLLRAMESAGKTVDDEELREAMKENGIGRPSTRSAIIETLFKRRYLRRERKNILPTDAGIQLVDTIRTDLLKSAKLTGLWENKLRRIERGAFSATEFIDEIKQMVLEVVSTVVNDRTPRLIKAVEPEKPTKTAKSAKTTKPRTRKTSAKKTAAAPASLSDIVCPACGKGHLIRGHSAVGCTAYKDGCRFVIPFAELGSAEPSPADVVKFLEKHKN